jgi:diguanylate cyclase (GGDEF)-like protein/PAS domain S-box-containing protein
VRDKLAGKIAAMKLKLQNYRIGTRIGLALVLPIAGLLVFSLWVLAGYYRSAQDIGNIRNMAEFAPAVGALVHALQKERGVSTGSVGFNSASAAFAARLPARRQETEEQRAEFLRSLSRFNAERIGGGLAARIASAREAVDQIPAWRGAFADRAITAAELSKHYSDAIAKLIEIVEEMQIVGADTNLARTIYAYRHLVQAKESAGLERAAGVAGFAAGRFDRASQMRFGELIDRQRLTLDEFKSFASAGQAALLDAALAGPDAVEVERMRRIVIESRSTGSIRAVDSLWGTGATQWFDTMTRKIDLLKGVEDRIASDLIAQSIQAEESATRAVRWVSVLTAIMLAFTVTLAAVIARGVILPLVRITNAMSKLAARDETAEIEIEIKDYGRGDEIGDMARALIVFRKNLSQAVHAEERLKSEVRYRAVIQSANDAIITADSAGNIVGWNRHAEIIFGYTEAEVNAQPLTLLMPYRYRELHLAGMRQAMSGGEPRVIGKTIEVEGLRKDQSEFPMELSLAQWEIAEGRFVTGTVRDITERKQTEQQLRVAATAFESQEGMMITDANQVILRVNRAFTRITGYTAEEAIGQPSSLLKSSRHDAAFYAAMWESLQGTGTWQGEIWNRRKNGEIYPEWLFITAVFDGHGQVTNYVAAFSDITQRKQAEDKIEQLAFYDPLTGLPNRRLLVDRLRQAIASGARNARHGALLFIDLDNFKTLNDTLGHDIGDLLLQQVARRLATCVREGDSVARLGGDEFVVMLEDLSDNAQDAATQTEVVGEKILATLNKPYQLASYAHHSTPSIGVTLFADHQGTIDDLLKRADLAMYQAKAAGRNTLRFFEPEMQAVVTTRAALEAGLREAFLKNQFLLHYQGQFDGEGCLTGVEALLRWQHPQRGLVPPLEFIPLAEDTGLILPIGLWVLETACEQLSVWAKRPETADLTMAVNVSAHQFRQPDFVGQVLAALDCNNADAGKLKLELTESMLVSNVEDIIAKMTTLKAKGVGFSLDDFGTGYSSLSYLKRLPLDQLKIDQSFVREVLTNSNDTAIAQTIIALGQNLGLAVIAEGVETEAQRDFLAASGCHNFQGYLFGRPGPAEELQYAKYLEAAKN